MLPQRHRLRDRAVFQKLYRSGKRYRGLRLTLICLPRVMPTRNGELPGRWAFAISKKVSRRAVDRNRIRRRLRECVRQMLPDLHSGWDTLAIVRPTPQDCDRPLLLSCSTAEACTEVRDLVERAGLLTRSESFPGAGS